MHFYHKVNLCCQILSSNTSPKPSAPHVCTCACAVPVNTGTKQPAPSAIIPGWPRSCSLKAAWVPLCPTSSALQRTPTRTGIPTWHIHRRPCVRPQVSSHRASAACHKHLLWAAEQYYHCSGKAAFTHHESQFLSAPPFQLPGEHHLGSPTAAQALSLYVSILLLQAEQPYTYSLVLPQLSPPGILHFSTPLFPLPSITHSCPPRTHAQHMSALRSNTQAPCSSDRYCPTLSEITVWVKSVVIIPCVVTAGFCLQRAVHKNATGLLEGLSVLVAILNFNCQVACSRRD